MKKTLLFLGFLSTFQLIAQKPVFVTAKTNAVTLYLNGAELSHTASVGLQKGTNEIVIKNISNQLDDNSIRVSSNKPVTILSAAFSNRYYNEYEVDPNSVLLKKVQDSIVLINKDLLSVRNTIETEQQTIQLLDKNKEIGGTNSGVNVLELSKIVDYYRQKRLEIANNINSLQEKEQKLNKTLQRLQNQLTFTESQEEKISNGKIVLQVMSDYAQTIQFDLAYITNLAAWSPFYEIEAKSVDQPLHLTTKGKVVQNTGVDWKQVKLSLSSTQPNPNNAIPYFSQWVLSFNQPYRREYGNVPPPPTPTMNKNIAYDKQLEEVQVTSSKKISQTSANYTAVSEQVLSVNFDISIPYDIYSNGKAHTVALSEQDVPASFSYYAAPKLNKDAYLIAQIADYSQYNLLAGEANIVFEGMFVGKTFLDPASTKDTLEVALGVDKNVIIKREKVSEKSGNKVLSGYKESAFTYDISVRNNKKSAIKLVLKDQFPISADKEVTVELTEVDRAKLNSDVGTLTWELEIKPQETKKIRFGYKVKYPKDKTIYNL
ncbi:MAG: DUF4139 domain-containing protein [Flavobacteriia bacterium]|nr:DUF4139 domain-containing protein [Flavobacteriia bacterium]OJX36372.1 MAG: hypothetical protein BGO87_05495 [Flavobacteriia bacterium 40-80]